MLLLWNIYWALVLVAPVLARRQLTAKSLVPCMENSQLTASTFQVNFNPDTRALSYNLDLNSEVDGYVTAVVEVYAYGFKIIDKSMDLCNLSFKQFCPLYSGSVIVDSTEYVSQKYVNMIPGVAFTVPDIDGYVKVKVYDTTNNTQLACMAAYFENGKTVAHTGVKWATAVVAGLGLLASAILSTFGSSNAAAHISVNASSLFTYFQSVVLCAMLHVESVPPIASAWAENLAWSMGLIRVEFMQKIFRWYVQATGGTPSLYFKNSETSILVQRSIEHVAGLWKRASALIVNSSEDLLVFRGIKRIGYNAHIEITSIVVTGFTFFVLCGYVLSVILLLIRFVATLVHKKQAKANPQGTGSTKNVSKFLSENSKFILKGALLRYCLIGLPQLLIFSLWEFTQKDSPAVIILAILFLVSVLGITVWATYRAWTFGNQSIKMHKNPAAILYGNQEVLSKYGFIYTMYNANMYWWGAVFLVYIVVKSIFVGLCQASGKVQALVIFVLDLSYMIAIIRKKPYLDRSTNILNVIIATVVMLNSFFFLFFSDLFKQPAAVSSIMGWLFFIINAGFSLVLLVIIIVYIVIVSTSKVPDTRFRRAMDDRTSFQRNSMTFQEKHESYSGGAGELFDLGLTAQDHQNNWEDEIYKLQDMASSQEFGTQENLELKSKNTIEEVRRSSMYLPDDDLDEPVNVATKPSAVESFGTKLAHTLSLKKRKDQQINSLTNKLSAMKLSKESSVVQQSNSYQQLPTSSRVQSTSIPKAVGHVRSVSQTPINSPNLNDFTFSDEYNLLGAYANPTTSVDFLSGKQSTQPDSSPYRN